MHNPTIIVAAYSRYKSLIRLLDSINNAAYPDEGVNLIISLDGGATSEVVDIAESFVFMHGHKSVVRRTENMGLRKHIMWCGDQTAVYGSVIVLEDDLFVDRFFYKYATEALIFYKDDPKIAGIALYSPARNEYIDLPFQPLNDGSTGYFMQIACSWGQAWTTHHWIAFKKWLSKITLEEIEAIDNLPNAVKNWPESSWKKYFSAYLALNKLYFIYPYLTFTTNCSDPGGVHIQEGTNLHQVSLRLQSRESDAYFFKKIKESHIKYDAFFESNCDVIYNNLGINEIDIEIDIYASKSIKLLQKKKFSLTTRNVKKSLGSFPLSFKPIEIIFETNQNQMTNNVPTKFDFCLYLSLSSDVLNHGFSRLKISQYYSNFDFLTKLHFFQLSFFIAKKVWNRIMQRFSH